MILVEGGQQVLLSMLSGRSPRHARCCPSVENHQSKVRIEEIRLSRINPIAELTNVFRLRELINGVDVPTSLVRAGLIFVFIGMGHGLVALGVITIVCTVGAGAAKAVLVFRQDPALSVRPGQMSAAMARKLFTFGFWQFVVSIGITVRKTIPRLVIGWWMGPGMVTPFSIAERLPMQARQLHVSATGVITPLAAALHARDDDARQKQLMIWGARFCGAMALCFAVPFILLGRPFITLWMGKEFAGVAVLLAILSVGEFLPLTQQVTGSIIVGKAKHRSLAILELLSAVLIAGGTVLAIVRHELLGVCINVAAVTTVTHGAARIILGCRMLGVSSKQYILGGILPPLLAVMPAAGLLALLVAWRGADSWTMLLAYGAVYVICYAVTCLLLIGRDMRRNLIRGTATMLSGN